MGNIITKSVCIIHTIIKKFLNMGREKIMAGGGEDMPAFEMAKPEEMIAASALSKLGVHKGLFLNELITDARNGNEEKLHAAVLYLKAGMALKKISLTDVMKLKDLIPLLILGLKSNTIPLKLNASWIICDIMVKGTPAQRKKFVGKGGDIYSILLKMLASPEEKIWQHALNTLVWIFDKEGTRPQLRDPAIIPAITKLAEKTENTAQLRNVGKVACFFCQRKSNKDHPHSLDTVRKLVALYKILYRKTKDDQITTDLTQSLIFLLNVEGIGSVIISGGLLPWVVGHLSHPNRVLRWAVIHIISKVAGKGPQMIDFFEALKETEELKGLYKVVQDSKVVNPDTGEEYDKANIDMSRHLEQFFQKVMNALVQLHKSDSSLKRELVNAVLDSGFVVSLVKCLEEKKTPEPFPFLAVSIMTNITDGADPEQLNRILEMGAIPSLVKLLCSPHKLVRWLAVVCLGQGNLIKTGPKVRDEVIRLGGLDMLMRLLEKHGREEVVGTVAILVCFEDLLATEPRISLNKYEKIPDYFKGLLDLDFAEAVQVRVFKCVGHLAAYGENGLQLLEKCGILEKMIEMLPYDHPEVQHVGLETLVRICKADEKYVPVLIKNGILDHVEVLSCFRETKFVSGYKVFIDYLWAGITPIQRLLLNHILHKEKSAVPGLFEVLKGSENPVAAFQVKINKVLHEQAGRGGT